jgi:iron complex transport system ATP-binding protein
VLELKDVTARYPARYLGDGKPAIAGISLRVEEAHAVALLGANGAGKSTLLRVAAGLLVAREGQVLVGGRDASTLGARALAREIGFVPQTEQAAPGFSVRDVVAMGRAPHQGAWMRERSQDRAAVGEAIARCDLGGLADRAVEALSGGEQRRVAIARALAQEPKLLLLDEPTAFLDVRHRLELHELLRDVIAKRKIACLVATHDLDAASSFADRVVLMRAGGIVAVGRPHEVLTHAALSDALGVDVLSGVHGPSGERYYLAHRRSRTLGESV